MPTADLKYWIGFSKIPSIGPKRFHGLLDYFPNLETAWQAPLLELSKAGLEESIVAEVVRARQTMDLDNELARLDKEGVKIVTVQDDDYPALLKEIYGPPPLLYYRGELPKAEEFLLAVVGTRKPTPYGQQITQTLVSALAESGLTIVSGLAFGIDSIAHGATLLAHGQTIAVLGCGIERSNIYPVSNRHLAERILAGNGCIISEHSLGTPPLKHHFPRRNRIISGLSLGTLIIEAPIKSGALITATFALEQNREVFSVPGNITSLNSSGTNNLIKMGAKLITEANDILDALNLRQASAFRQTASVVPDTAEEAQILTNLSREPRHVDDLTRLTNLSIQTINATLTLMEMKGKVRHLGAMKYVLAR